MKTSPAGVCVRLLLLGILLCLTGSLFPLMADAKSAREIDAGVDDVLEQFAREVNGGQEFLRSAKGVLVLPRVYKAGFGFGGKYGEGALRINGRTVDFYRLFAGSYGLQLGAQRESVILVFMQDEALRKFRDSSGWRVGVDASVSLATLGAGKTVDTNTIRDPIVGFVIGQEGLMYDVSLEGAKLQKVNKNR
jgi:lipid-binding SYLF domain-containing protein